MEIAQYIYIALIRISTLGRMKYSTNHSIVSRENTKQFFVPEPAVRRNGIFRARPIRLAAIGNRKLRFKDGKRRTKEMRHAEAGVLKEILALEREAVDKLKAVYDPASESCRTPQIR